jgi:hypothetical protein
MYQLTANRYIQDFSNCNVIKMQRQLAASAHRRLPSHTSLLTAMNVTFVLTIKNGQIRLLDSCIFACLFRERRPHPTKIIRMVTPLTSIIQATSSIQKRFNIVMAINNNQAQRNN